MDSLKNCIAACLAVFLSAQLMAPCRADETNRNTIEFKGRQVDLDAFLDAFPYDNWRWEASLSQNVLYFLKQDGEKLSIYSTKLGADVAPAMLENANRAAQADLSKSLTFDWKVSKYDGSLYFMMDEDNDESFNLHVINADGALKRLTNVNYVAGYGFSPDFQKLAYAERIGPEGTRIRIHVLDLATGLDRVVAADTAEQQFTWGDISWRPDETGLVLTTLSNGDRNRSNLSYISADGDENQTPRPLTDLSVPRHFPTVTEHWVSDDEVIILSDETGLNNVFVLNVESGKQRQVTAFRSDVNEVFAVNGTSDVVLSVKSPLGTSIYRVDASQETHNPALILKSKSSLTILDVEGEELICHEKSTVLPFRVSSLKVESDQEPLLRPRVVMRPELIESVVRSHAEFVLYDTFDQVPMDLGGETLSGKIHGILYTPRDPLPQDESLVVVESFYGGGIEFDIEKQILCAAGLYVFSPSPRGTHSISAEFEKLNDGDLGGREVLDVMFGGAYVSERLGIPPNRIGVFGHSHGGYTTLRHLTFPHSFEGVNERFSWGFGIAESGFSSIRGVYDHSNVKAVVSKEAGDSAVPGMADRWEDRSPINHVDRLEANLLLIHGTRDKRCPFDGSQSFFDKAVAAGKEMQVVLAPLEGVGHVAVSRDDVVNRYKAWFSFLERQ